MRMTKKIGVYRTCGIRMAKQVGDESQYWEKHFIYVLIDTHRLPVKWFSFDIHVLTFYCFNKGLKSPLMCLTVYF